jgi:hypothetical protein
VHVLQEAVDSSEHDGNLLSRLTLRVKNHLAERDAYYAQKPRSTNSWASASCLLGSVRSAGLIPTELVGGERELEAI